LEIFFVSGSIGFIWVAFWSYFYRLPKGRPKWDERLPKDNIYITDKELDYIQTALAKEQKEIAQQGTQKVDWIKLFKDMELWRMIVAKFLTDAVWYFYIIWTPKYLFDARTLPTDLYPRYKVGSVAGIIGSSGAFGGFAVQLIAGWMITTLGGYGPVFVTLSFMHPLAFLIILIMIPRITRLDRR
jgi:hypothetical protein